MRPLTTLFSPYRSPFLTSWWRTAWEWHKRSQRVNTRLQRESAINTIQYVRCNINSALILLVCLNVIDLGISTCCVPFGLICLLGWQRNVVCLRYKNGVQCSIYMWPWTSLEIALPVNICRTALPVNTTSRSSCSPKPAIKCPMLPRKLICMWNPLSLSTIPFRSLPSGWDWIVVKAFQYRRLVKCEDGSGIEPPGLRRYKLHCSVDAGWIAGIEVIIFFPFSSTEWRSIKTTRSNR